MILTPPVKKHYPCWSADCAAPSIDISFSGINDTVMKVLVRTHLFNKIGADHVYPTMEEALRQIHPGAAFGRRSEDLPPGGIPPTRDHPPLREDSHVRDYGF